MRFKKFIFLLNNFFSERSYLLYLILFTIAFSVFSYIQQAPTFPDPDSFYHTKIAMLISEEGVVEEFPWLQFTVLNQYFTDHHFLYHLILVPFVLLFQPLLGVKLATVIFASLLIVVIFWFLKKMEIKGAFFYSLFLITVNPFIFRINLAKAQALAIIFLFLVLYFIFQRRYFALFVCGFLYVWLYGGWPLIIVLTLIYCLMSYRVFLDKGFFKKIELKIKKVKQKITYQNLKLLFSVLGGVVFGIILSPYFPKNLYFYWQQIFQIALVNYQKIIGVGGEWYPYKFFDLLSAAAPFFILLLLAFILFSFCLKEQSTDSIFLLILTFIFFVMTLKSRRNVEYLIPIGVVFSAFSINDFLKSLNLDFNLAVKRLKNFFGQSFFSLVMFTLVISLILPFIFFRDIKSVKLSYNGGLPFSKFEAASLWLSQNSLPGQIIFHSDWDEFPNLFYHNSQNYYIIGLDPTFMYKYNKDLYWDFVNVTTGKEKENLYEIIVNKFGASYVLVNILDNTTFERNLKYSFYFKEVYRDNEVAIYKPL